METASEHILYGYKHFASSFEDKIDVKHVYTEFQFAIGSQFIRHALDDSEPVADLQAAANEQTSEARVYTGLWSLAYRLAGSRCVTGPRSADHRTSRPTIQSITPPTYGRYSADVEIKGWCGGKSAENLLIKGSSWRRQQAAQEKVAQRRDCAGSGHPWSTLQPPKTWEGLTDKRNRSKEQPPTTSDVGQDLPSEVDGEDCTRQLYRGSLVNTGPQTPAETAASVACPTDTTLQFAMLMQMMQAQATQMQTQLQEVKCNAITGAGVVELKEDINANLCQVAAELFTIRQDVAEAREELELGKANCTAQACELWNSNATHQPEVAISNAQYTCRCNYLKFSGPGDTALNIITSSFQVVGRATGKFDEYAVLFGHTDSDMLRCFNISLTSTAYYWWEVTRNSITNFQKGNDGHGQHPRVQSYQVDYYEPYHIHQYSSQRNGQHAFQGQVLFRAKCKAEYRDRQESNNSSEEERQREERITELVAWGIRTTAIGERTPHTATWCIRHLTRKRCTILRKQAIGSNQDEAILIIRAESTRAYKCLRPPHSITTGNSLTQLVSAQLIIIRPFEVKLQVYTNYELVMPGTDGIVGRYDLTSLRVYHPSETMKHTRAQNSNKDDCERALHWHMDGINAHTKDWNGLTVHPGNSVQKNGRAEEPETRDVWQPPALALLQKESLLRTRYELLSSLNTKISEPRAAGLLFAVILHRHGPRGGITHAVYVRVERSSKYLYLNPATPNPARASYLQSAINKVNVLRTFCIALDFSNLRPASKTRISGRNRAYEVLAENLSKLQTLAELPSYIRLNRFKLNDLNICETFIAKSANWHKSCSSKFNDTEVRRAEEIKRKETSTEHPVGYDDGDDTPVRPKRNKTSIPSPDLCFFCDKLLGNGRYLHRVLAKSVDRKIRERVSKIGDSILAAKLAEGDMIAREQKYHHLYLVNLYNSCKDTSDTCDDNIYSVIRGIAISQTRGTKQSVRHQVDREPPLPLYFAMKIHAHTRKKEIVDMMHSLDLSISYARLLRISSSLCEVFVKRIEENKAALRMWMLGGPEITQLIAEFEKSNVTVSETLYMHHEQTPGFQNMFAQKVIALKDQIQEREIPFLEKLDRSNLFSELFIICNTRDLNLDEFFAYENQSYPPSLSVHGALRTGNKSALLQCFQNEISDAIFVSHVELEEENEFSFIDSTDDDQVHEHKTEKTEIECDAIFYYGPAVVHTWQPRLENTFGEYADFFKEHIKSDCAKLGPNELNCMGQVTRQNCLQCLQKTSPLDLLLGTLQCCPQKVQMCFQITLILTRFPVIAVHSIALKLGEDRFIAMRGISVHTHLKAGWDKLLYVVDSVLYTERSQDEGPDLLTPGSLILVTGAVIPLACFGKISHGTKQQMQQGSNSATNATNHKIVCSVRPFFFTFRLFRVPFAGSSMVGGRSVRQVKIPLGHLGIFLSAPPRKLEFRGHIVGCWLDFGGLDSFAIFAGKTGDARENPQTTAIVRNDSHGSPWWEITSVHVNPPLGKKVSWHREDDGCRWWGGGGGWLLATSRIVANQQSKEVRVETSGERGEDVESGRGEERGFTVALLDVGDGERGKKRCRQRENKPERKRIMFNVFSTCLNAMRIAAVRGSATGTLGRNEGTLSNLAICRFDCAAGCLKETFTHETMKRVSNVLI
ncbi:hypothetical protein PR048_029808 [Dryococelus australis]|uniref:Uncharacterized protein n=1 Tax=Dryococelus australis TaxID=614101 RepID=A0ABQ9G839_9NEOP|nr:hypothetical protein PR048_029808 [Dryococelus australis]